MSTREKPLSIAEVFELPSGDKDNPSWVGEFTGVVNRLTPKTSKEGKKYWVCVIGDLTGSAEIEMSVFTAPKFYEGDVIEVTGQGMRRTEYQGKAQVALSQKSQVLKVAASAHHEEQQHRRADSRSALNSAAFTVPGPTVGMAINNAIDVLTKNLDTRDAIIERLCEPGFWMAVHETASDIIRLSRLLEAGKLAPSVKERSGGASAARPEPPPQPTRPSPQPAAPRKAPTDEQLANRDEYDQENIPF